MSLDGIIDGVVFDGEVVQAIANYTGRNFYALRLHATAMSIRGLACILYLEGESGWKEVEGGQWP